MARRPCRARTQECGHLQFEAMCVHTPTVIIVAYSCEYGYFLKSVRVSVKYNRRLSSGGTASVVYAVILYSCWRAVALNLTAMPVFLAKEQAQESCYSVAEIYGELRRDLQLLREKLHIGFDVVQV